MCAKVITDISFKLFYKNEEVLQMFAIISTKKQKLHSVGEAVEIHSHKAYYIMLHPG